jgi:hypothetical protein
MSIMTGTFGVLLAKFHHVCLVGVFAFLSFVTSVGYVCIGSMMILIFRGADKAFLDFCNGDASENGMELYNLFVAMEMYVKPYINEYMCSMNCPCDVSFKDVTLPQSAITQVSGF